MCHLLVSNSQYCRLNAANEEIRQNQQEIARYRSGGGAGSSSAVGHVSTVYLV